LAETPLVRQLLAACLHGKVRLPVGNDRLGRVAVLDDEVAGVAGEPVVRYPAGGTGAEFDHFVERDKMVGDGLAGALAGRLGLFNDLHKVAPSLVLQHRCQVPRKPELGIVLVQLPDAFECPCVLGVDTRLSPIACSPGWWAPGCSPTRVGCDAAALEAAALGLGAESLRSKQSRRRQALLLSNVVNCAVAGAVGGLEAFGRGTAESES
jgi:hypothetical protein